jgi:hypothetical protein
MRVFFALSVVLAVGCKKSPGDEFKAFGERMCACKDRECIEQTTKDLDAWMKSPNGTALRNERGAWIDEVEKKIKDCRRNGR